ncbi:hypothetical protein FACS18949_03480 [Clostridia bacterium]|nr:hypothetical protein FACS18949_03480 [Clostridia bacterium]
MQKFSDNLTTLMNLYRINNSSLSKGMDVDPSLVSRWKSGSRVPSRRSGVPSDIANYLAGLGMLQHDRETLVKLLNCPCETREETAQALAKFLLGDASGISGVHYSVDFDPESPEVVSEMFSRLGKIFSAEARLPTEPVSLFALVKKGAAGTHETFSGEEGLRQALLNLLHDAITHRSAGDIYLMPPVDDEWLLGDAKFAKLYTNALRAAVQAGHTIHVAHPKPRGSELPLLLSAYMPLYATGRFLSYGRSSEVTEESPAVFVLHGQAAILSYNFAGTERHNTLMRAAQDVELCEKIISAQLSGSKPLATACVREAPLKLAERLIQLMDAPGELFEVRNTLDAVFLPDGLAYELLKQQLPTHLMDRHLDMLARWREAVFSQVENVPWTILLPTAVCDAISINGTCRISGIELLAPKDVTLEGEDLRAYLEHIIALTERYPNLKFKFIDDCPATNITVKDKAGTFFIADTTDSQPSAVFVGDMTLCEALCRWFSARSREGDDSDEPLKEALEFLS